jgi:PIN domain nuclease of toxin-antitoxin system
MAIIAALTREPAMAEVERLLRDRDEPPRIAAVNLAEVVDVLVRVKSFRRDQVDQAISWLEAGGLTVVATTDVIARSAGDLRARHYHNRTCVISLCDCVALATARALDERLATADPALSAASRRESVALIPLPDSSGQRS